MHRAIEELSDDGAREAVSQELNTFMDSISRTISYAVEGLSASASERRDVYATFEDMFATAMVGGFVVGQAYERASKDEVDDGTER